MNATLSRLAALFLAVSLSAAACSSGNDDTSAVSTEAGDASPASVDDAAGSLLEITAPAADGSTIDLSDYAGQDLMLWFWAPW